MGNFTSNLFSCFRKCIEICKEDDLSDKVNSNSSINIKNKIDCMKNPNSEEVLQIANPVKTDN